MRQNKHSSNVSGPKSNLRFDKHQATCLNMAVVNVSLFIISILLSSARSNPTCNETQCKLLPIGEDVVLKFQELAAEEGVRIIYLNTEMGNDSYHPLESNERFFAKRWVWANKISEPMLSLLEDKDDYVVYSIGLLKYQVRYLKVPLQDQPRGCLARLNTSCQNNVVGQTLLANFTKVSSDERVQKAAPTDCVCALHIVDSTKLKQVCCSEENFTELNYPRVHCKVRAQSTWLKILVGFKTLLSLILVLCSTALPLLLPDWIINLQHEYERDQSMQTQIRNIEVMPDQQNAYELDQREDSDNIHGEDTGGDRNLHRNTDNESNDEQSGNQSSDSHRGIELRHGTDETGNEDNLISARPTNQFENNMNEGIDQHQTRRKQGSNDSVGREVLEQGTNEEDFSYVGERSVQRDSHDQNNDEQQQTSNQVPSDHQQETYQSVDLIIDDETRADDSYVGTVVNPYGKRLTVVREDQEALDRKIPLDDTSPITFGALLSDYAKDLPDFQINFNLKMLLLCFAVFPFFVYLKLALIIFERMESNREFYQTFKNCSQIILTDFISCSAIVGFSPQKGAIYMTTFYFLGCIVLFIIVLSIRPKDLFYSNDDLLLSFHGNCPSVSLGHEIIIHLNLLHHWAYDLTFFTLWKYISVLKTCLLGRVLCKITLQRRIRTFRSLCYFFGSLVGLLLSAVLGTICIVVFLLSLGILILFFSPLGTSYIFLVKKFMGIIVRVISFSRSFVFILVFVISTFCFTPLVLFTSSILFTSADFIIKVFLFTVIGLVLNAELITPYVAFTLVVTRNLYLCYSNLQSRYKEVKDIIAKHWKENIEEPPGQDSDDEETIPKELFWFVCGKGKSDHQKNVLPLRAEICSMLRDMVLILTFLSVSLFAILVFRSMNDISALVSTIFVFVSGVIPSLIFQGFTNKEKFSGWNKIKIERKIKEAVKEYISRQTEGTLDSDSFQWFLRYRAPLAYHSGLE